MSAQIKISILQVKMRIADLIKNDIKHTALFAANCQLSSAIFSTASDYASC